MGHLSFGNNSEWDLRVFRLREHVANKLLIRRHCFEVEVVEQQWNGQTDSRLCESLSEANALSTKEGTEGEWAALASVGSRIEGRLRVEAVREELIRSLPFFLVPHHAHDVDVEGAILGEVHTVDGDVLRKARGARQSRRWVQSHSLVKAVARKGEVFRNIGGQLSHEVVRDLAERTFDLLEQSLLVLGVEVQKLDHVGGGDLNRLHARGEHDHYFVDDILRSVLIVLVLNQDSEHVHGVLFVLRRSVLLFFLNNFVHCVSEPVRIV